MVEQYQQNVLKQNYVDPETDPSEGVLESGVSGAVSGMAMRLVSDAMRCDPKADRPTPPPMVTPLIIATNGLENRKIRRFRVYSS